MKVFIISFIILIATSFAGAQVAINNTGNDPDNSAMLDISSGSKGFLIPRMTSAERRAIANPANGLMVFQTGDTTGIFVNTGTPLVPSWFCIDPETAGVWAIERDNSTIFPSDDDLRLGLGIDSAWQQLHLTGSIEMPVTNSLDTTAGIIFKNGETFLHNFHAEGTFGYNTFVGIGSGNLRMTKSPSSPSPWDCSDNTAVGSYTLNSITSGKSNTAIGYKSLSQTIIGEYNTAIGSGTMMESPGGLRNLAAGSYTLYYNSGSDNVGLGYRTLYNNSNGSDNIGIGSYALNGKTGGSSNIAIGRSAASGNVSVSDKVFSRNVVLGYAAGSQFISGADNNILIGYGTGDNISSGANNLILGYNLDAPVADGDHQMYIGGVLYGDLEKKQLSVGNTSPDESAILELESDSLGLLIPRMTESQRTNISNPATGLLVFQTDEESGLYFNNGTPVSPNWLGVGPINTGFWNYHSGNQSVYLDNSTYKVGLGTNDPDQQLELTGSIELPSTYGSSPKGIIYKGASPFIHDYYDLGAAGRNTFIGINSGNFTMANNLYTFESSFNSAVGNETLSNLTIGYYNTAFGSQTLHELTSGNNNSAFGGNALVKNLSGHSNTAIGSFAGYNIYGSCNTIVGSDAAKMCNYIDSNVVIGYSAASSLAGNSNIIIGSTCADNLSSGDRNIIIGHNLDAPNGSNSDQLCIGGLIYGDMANNKVGIGTYLPSSNLHITNDYDCILEVESWLVGRPLIRMDASHTTNSEIQFQKDGTYMGAIGYNNTNDNIFFYEDYSMVYKNGQLGIRVTSPTYTLQLPNSSSSGEAVAYAWNTYSDKRIKKQIKPLQYGLKEIINLNPVSYVHYSQASEENVLRIDHQSGTPTIGLIAQEVWEILPETVYKPENKDKELWSIDYSRIIPVIVKGIQELKQENDLLKMQNKQLIRQLENFEKRLKKLE